MNSCWITLQRRDVTSLPPSLCGQVGNVSVWFVDLLEDMSVAYTEKIILKGNLKLSLKN
jgi:hypothetical protein